jgi:3-isopropylmalate dehydrogenase
MSVGLLLDFLGRPEAAARVDRAVEAYLAERGDDVRHSTTDAGARLAALAAK